VCGFPPKSNQPTLEHVLPHIWSTYCLTFGAHTASHLQHILPHIWSTNCLSFGAQTASHLEHILTHIWSAYCLTFGAHTASHLEHILTHIWSAYSLTLGAHTALHLERILLHIWSAYCITLGAHTVLHLERILPHIWSAYCITLGAHTASHLERILHHNWSAYCLTFGAHTASHLKRILPHIVKKLQAFHATKCSFPCSQELPSLTIASAIFTTSSQTIHLRSILIVFSQLCFSYPSGRLVFPLPLNTIHFSPTHATYRLSQYSAFHYSHRNHSAISDHLSPPPSYAAISPLHPVLQHPQPIFCPQEETRRFTPTLEAKIIILHIFIFRPTLFDSKL